MNQETYDIALMLADRLIKLEPKPNSVEGKALYAISDMIIEYEKRQITKEQVGDTSSNR